MSEHNDAEDYLAHPDTNAAMEDAEEIERLREEAVKDYVRINVHREEAERLREALLDIRAAFFDDKSASEISTIARRALEGGGKGWVIKRENL